MINKTMLRSSVGRIADLTKFVRTRIGVRNLGSKPSWQTIGHRFEMEIDPNDFMDCSFYMGNYDPQITFVMEHWLKEGDVCIDVGAQKGFITLYAANCTGKSGRVFAFEPDMRARQFLEKNCSRNGLGNVAIFGYALGKENGEKILYLSSQLGWSSHFPNSYADKTIVSEIRVPVRSIDTLLSTREVAIDIERLTFVKIDCEGAEPFVLRGMKHILEYGNPLLWIEINPESLRTAQSSPAELMKILAEFGYAAFLPKRINSILAPLKLGLVRINVLTVEYLRSYVDIVAFKPGLSERLTNAGIRIFGSPDSNGKVVITGDESRSEHL